MKLARVNIEYTIMLAKKYLVLVVLLTVLWLCGCNKPPSQNANLNSEKQETTAQPNSEVAPTGSNSATFANSGQDSSSTLANGVTSTSNPELSSQPSPQLTVPAGTPITVRLQEHVSSASAEPGQRFEAVLEEPIVVENQVLAPTGTLVRGHVVEARRSGRLRHPGELGLTLDSLVVNQQSIPLVTSDVFARGGSHRRRNWAWIGGGGGGGALIGALAAGGKGALIGSGIGAVAGATTALATGKKDVGFSSERDLRFRLKREVNLPG